MKPTFFSERYHCITGMFFYLAQVIGMWSARNHITLNALMQCFLIEPPSGQCDYFKGKINTFSADNLKKIKNKTNKVGDRQNFVFILQKTYSTFIQDKNLTLTIMC